MWSNLYLCIYVCNTVAGPHRFSNVNDDNDVDVGGGGVLKELNLPLCSKSLLMYQ